METGLHSKRILIIGGTGAFGQKFLAWSQKKNLMGATILSRDEMKHAALKREWNANNYPGIRFMVGDITHPEDLQEAMRDVDIVVHAAAMKHLPECEANPVASVRVNIEGTLNVIRAFQKSRAEALVFLSTDKATYASTVYGAQKLIGEKFITNAAKELPPGKKAYTLRYSNVMDSTGSAFHIFKQLLSAGKTATVNGSQVFRGFVSQLTVLNTILTTLSMAKGGEVFVLIPQIVQIAELAQTMTDIIGSGATQVVEQSGFAGEKELATLVMKEELSFAKEFNCPISGKMVMLDFNQQHPELQKMELPKDGFTLDHCSRLTGSALKEFVSNLL